VTIDLTEVFFFAAREQLVAAAKREDQQETEVHDSDGSHRNYGRTRQRELSFDH
jgi:hypothetical protein